MFPSPAYPLAHETQSALSVHKNTRFCRNYPSNFDNIFDNTLKKKVESDAFIGQIKLHEKRRKHPKIGIFLDFIEVFSDAFLALHTRSVIRSNRLLTGNGRKRIGLAIAEKYSLTVLK